MIYYNTNKCKLTKETDLYEKIKLVFIVIIHICVIQAKCNVFYTSKWVKITFIASGEKFEMLVNENDAGRVWNLSSLNYKRNTFD